MYNANLFNSVQALKTTFGNGGMHIPAGPAKVVPGLSESFVNIATTIFQNTPEGAGRDTILGSLYQEYLGVTGYVCSSWKHGNA